MRENYLSVYLYTEMLKGVHNNTLKHYCSIVISYRSIIIAPHGIVAV